MKTLIKQKGFTLVELAVVLGIVSVLAIGSATLFSEQKVNVELDVQRDKLATVKVALLRFAEQNHYLPCPDTNVFVEDGFGTENRENTDAVFPAVWATFGTPAQAATATSPFIPAVPAQPAQPARIVNVDACVATEGTVPFEMIGLSLADVQDTQGNMFHYAVTRGVSSAQNMANCPEDSACFFNRNVTPAFSNLTEPVAGSPGVNNLTVCSALGCNGANLLSNGLIAVILAFNKNENLSAGEVENRDNDAVFIMSPYVREGDESFDDLLVSISGHELRSNDEQEFQVSQVPGSFGTASFVGNDLENMGDTRVGGVGTNVWTDDVIWDTASEGFDFGVEAANQNIVLTYDTRAIGTWDQPGGYNHNGVTSDTATVSSNGDLVKEYKYEHRDDTQTGRIQVKYRDVANDPDGDSTITRTVDYWDDSTEVIIQTDSEGKINLEFAVGTTANYETIDFTNIELVYYNTPPPIPNFPSVAPVYGIEQTEGLL